MRTMIPVDKVIVEYDRIREDLGDLNVMQESIKRFGQLQPIILSDTNALIDGFRRFTSMKLMGHTEVWYINQGNVDELLSRELELEANLLRKDMTWQEKAKGLAELDRVKRERNPNWNQNLTAAVAGTSQRQISQSISITKMAELFPEINEAKTLKQALNIAKSKATQLVRQKEVSDAPQIFASIEERIILGDSVEVIRSVPDRTFDAIITDPPFGVDYDKRVSNTVGAASAYQDDAASYERILSMAPDMYRVLKDNGWLVWFCGISWYERIKEVFRASGFTVDEIPIIWDRSIGRTFTSRPDRWFTRGYDIAIHAIKGEPRMVLRNRSNVIQIAPVEGSDRELLVERPVELYSELISRLTIPGEVVADFFVGSGSCPAAAASLGRKYFGVELDPGRRATAIKKIRSHTPS